MKILKLVLISTLFLAFWGCNDDDEVAYKVTTDAYLRGMYVGKKVGYAPVLVASSTTKTARLTASDNVSKRYFLESYWNNPLIYRWVPKEGDYLVDFPENMKYSFIAVPENDDKKSEFTVDVSLDQVPNSFPITDLTFDIQKHEITVKWKASNADAYAITISKELDGMPIYQSLYLFPKEEGEENFTATVDKNSFKWYSNLESGKKYVIAIHGYNLEAATNNKILGEFVAIKEFTWTK